jgi:uncharacterized protein YoxC
MKKKTDKKVVKKITTKQAQKKKVEKSKVDQKENLEVLNGFPNVEKEGPTKVVPFGGIEEAAKEVVTVLTETKEIVENVANKLETTDWTFEKFEDIKEGVEEFIKDVKEVVEDIVEEIKEIPQSVKDTFERFINIYSPPVITKENAEIKEEKGRYKIVVNSSAKGIESSMPKFIDSLEVEIKK